MMLVTSTAKTIAEFKDEIAEAIRVQSNRYASQVQFSKTQGEVNKGKAQALHQLAQFIDDIVLTGENNASEPRREDGKAP